MRYVKILLGLLFLISAFIQFNDPDPFRWVLLYGLSAVVTLLSAFNVSYRLLDLLTLAVIIFELVTSAPGFVDWIGHGMPDITGKMEDASPSIEETREFFGALICLLVVGYLYFQHRNQRKQENSRL